LYTEPPGVGGGGLLVPFTVCDWHFCQWSAPDEKVKMSRTALEMEPWRRQWQQSHVKRGESMKCVAVVLLLDLLAFVAIA